MSILERAKELRKVIKKHEVVFIVGHKDLDLDAIGSALGMSYIVEKFKREAYIIIDDETFEPAVGKIINQTQKSRFIKSSNLFKKKKNKNLLVVVDTNKEKLLQNHDLINEFEDVVVIDHHQPNSSSIQKGMILIDTESSSACELITELIYYYGIHLEPEIATTILGGIVLDTNNFVVKTQAKTYFAAYHLTSFGADPRKVQYYLKQDIKDYIIRQKVIIDVEIINDKFAVTVGDESIKYKREELAKVADTLLQFNGITASFVIGKITDGTIGISARSEGKTDVGKLLEQLGGGGGSQEAATQIQENNMNHVKKQLLKILK